MLIFVAISGRSFKILTLKARPPVISVKSYRSDGPIPFFRRRPAIWFEQPDGVNLNIRFLHKLPNVRFAVPTVIIASVRYDEQSFLCVVCSFHLAEAEINAVRKERSARARRYTSGGFAVRPRCP